MRRNKNRCLFKVVLWVYIINVCFTPINSNADIKLHFLDVGQGDCTIITCDNESLIIDGGPPAASQYVYWYIRENLGIDEFQYMIASHPHEDHLGGLSAALNSAVIGVIMSPVKEWDSRAFRSMVKYANLQGTPIIVPEEGDVFSLGEGTITILSCWPEAWDVNCMSIVCRIDYHDLSFLFTGDAEDMLEYILVDTEADLSADVLKVGHHGSSTSTTQEFLDMVKPRYAVISCGQNNEYGHPRKEVLERLSTASVFRTDRQGTITMTSDGKTINITTESDMK